MKNTDQHMMPSEARFVLVLFIIVVTVLIFFCGYAANEYFRVCPQERSFLEARW